MFEILGENIRFVVCFKIKSVDHPQIIDVIRYYNATEEMCIGGNIDNISHTGECLRVLDKFNIEFNVAEGINISCSTLSHSLVRKWDHKFLFIFVFFSLEIDIE